MPKPKCRKRDASGKKGKLSGKLLCCNCLLDQIKANVAEIQPENHQNVQRTHFSQKAPGVNGLNHFDNILHSHVKNAALLVP